MSGSVSLVIADRHPVFVRGLSDGLRESHGLTVVGTTSDGEEALSLVRRARPSIALVGITMNSLDGFQVARQILHEQLPTSVMFIADDNDPRNFDEAVAVGARGYLVKDMTIRDIRSAVERVAKSSYITPVMPTQKLVRRRPAESDTLWQLTESERKVLTCISNFKTSRQIARELSISVRTVDTHRNNICKKLGLEGRNALLRFGMLNKKAAEGFDQNPA